MIAAAQAVADAQAVARAQATAEAQAATEATAHSSATSVVTTWEVAVAPATPKHVSSKRATSSPRTPHTPAGQEDRFPIQSPMSPYNPRRMRLSMNTRSIVYEATCDSVSLEDASLELHKAAGILSLYNVSNVGQCTFFRKFT